MKPVLAIDTCGGIGYVGLLDVAAASLLAEESLPERGTQEALLPAIERALGTAKCEPSELAAIAVVVGPGSFTGVRIGLAAAKGLAEALDLPTIALSRLDVLLAAVGPTAKGAGDLYAWLDAGRGDVYTAQQLAPGPASSLGRGTIDSRDEAARRVRAKDVVTVLEPRLQDAVSGAVLVTEREYRRSLQRLTVKAFHSQNFADTALLDAEYLRVPDAEISLRARLAAEQGVRT